jgi:hypothetical protein
MTLGERMTTLQEVFNLAKPERGLVIVSTLRADRTIQSTLVNAGIIAHPETGETVLAAVVAGKVKLANMRARPQVSAAFRDGWRYATVEGSAEIAGPDDPQPWLDPEKPPPAAATTTGPNMTARWPPNAAPPC